LQEKLEREIQTQAFAYLGDMAARKKAKEEGKASSALVVRTYEDEDGNEVKKMVKEVSKQ